MAKFLRIALWNVNGISRHKKEIKIFLNHCSIDIFLISETHFTEKSYFKVRQYKFYHTNHPDNTAHAGTAILIKDTIHHRELPRYAKDCLQATSVKVNALPYDVTVSALYCPPRHNIKKNDFEDFFCTLGTRFIAGGDYNSKNTLWGCRLTTTKGRELAKLIQERNYSFLSTGTPTYWPSDPRKLPDLLDFFIASGISKSYMDVKSYYNLFSDHTPIIATIGTTVVDRKNVPNNKLQNPKSIE